MRIVRKLALWGCIVLVSLAALAYAADNLWARHRGRPVERIKVGMLYAAVNHWNEVEYSVGAPVVETCVEALMPHFGYTPCWYRSATPFGKSVRKGHAADLAAVLVCAKMRSCWYRPWHWLPRRRALSCCRGDRWARRALMAFIGSSLSNSWPSSSSSTLPNGFATRYRRANWLPGSLARFRWRSPSKGFRLLRTVGKASRTPERSANLPFENTVSIVGVGVYRWIRHPLYASLLCLAWCAGLKNMSATSVGLTVAASGFLVATAIVEESENLRFFGESYAAYMKTTRRFVPYLF